MPTCANATNKSELIYREVDVKRPQMFDFRAKLGEWVGYST